MSNKNLAKAKKTKNDEFYTKLTDIEKELKHYREHFKNKIIFCNCDNPERSNFWKFFELNFRLLGLKKLISTHYETEKPTYKLEYDGNTIIKTKLKQNGDFKSDECVELLKEADIVVTNPPFSLFREYVSLLIEYNKKFLIIGNMNAITYKIIFKLIKNNKLWICGSNKSMSFILPDESIAKINANWFTNLEIPKKHEKLTLYKSYTPEEYPKYDNYDAINVDKVVDIPINYEGIIGVPITFLFKYNPEQFEILGQMVNTTIDENNFGYPFINGKRKYARILIKKK